MPKDPQEQRLIDQIANGDKAARAVYADLLEADGRPLQAMFLRAHPDTMDPEWLLALGFVVVGGFMLKLDPTERARLSPVGFSIARFTRASGHVLGVSSYRVQRPMAWGRLIATCTRSGDSATGHISVERVSVGVNVLLDGSFPLAVLAPDSPLPMALSGYVQPGQDIEVVLRCDTPLPHGDDSITVALCALLNTVREARAPIDFGLGAAANAQELDLED